MKQFDVCRLRNPREQLVVNLRPDVVDELGTRVVAPLSEKPYRTLIDALHIPIELDIGELRLAA